MAAVAEPSAPGLPDGVRLMICPGATKAGTSWLHDYLQGHPDCHFRTVKELHYFDGLAEPADSYFRRRQRRMCGDRARDYRRNFFRDRREYRRRYRDMRDWVRVPVSGQTDHGAYLRYLTQGAAPGQLVGDVTPCYAKLDRRAFAQMAALPVPPLFVFLLRDPVDRAWSHVRMLAEQARNRENFDAPRRAQGRARHIFDRLLAGDRPEMWARSDYARTLRELMAVVPRERLHVEFYEDLHSDAAIFRLCDFLGIRHKPGAYDVVVFGGPKYDLDAARRARAVEVLREQYEFCEELTGGYLPDRWRRQMEA